MTLNVVARNLRRNTLRNNLSLTDIPAHLEHPYLCISFWGAARAHSKYLKLQNICAEALSWMRDRKPFPPLQITGALITYDADVIDNWMRGSGGFTRPHMPYYVMLTPQEWSLLIHAVRRAGTEDTEYAWMRFYAQWV